MGLLASHGLTHHLLHAARLRRCLSSSSSYSITMAATPIKMLKWARCASNSHLLSIVTTAGMTGASKVTDFLYLHPYLAGKLTITCPWPPDHLTVIHWFLDISWRSPGPPAVIGRSPGGGRRTEPRKHGHLGLTPAGGRTVARRWSAGDRWPSYQSGSRSSKSADELPISKNRHPAKM